MTYKRGFAGGLLFGLVLYAVFNGYLVFTPAPEVATSLVGLIAPFLLLLSVLVGIGTAIKRSSVFTPSGDGFIIGSMTTYELIFIAIQFAQGRLPVP